LVCVDQAAGRTYAHRMGSAVKNLYEAKTQLSSLVERASKGEEFVIAKDGVAKARLVPLEARAQRTMGCWKGKLRIADDFDELPEDELARWEDEPTRPRTKSKKKR